MAAPSATTMTRLCSDSDGEEEASPVASGGRGLRPSSTGRFRTFVARPSERLCVGSFEPRTGFEHPSNVVARSDDRVAATATSSRKHFLGFGCSPFAAAIASLAGNVFLKNVFGVKTKTQDKDMSKTCLVCREDIADMVLHFKRGHSALLKTCRDMSPTCLRAE